MSTTKPLRSFHNDVKRRMIARLSSNVQHHVDIACGRWVSSGFVPLYIQERFLNNRAEARKAAEALAPYRLSCLSLDLAPSHAAPSVHGEGGIGRSGP